MQPRPIRRDPWPWVGAASALAFLVLTVLVVRPGGPAFDAPLAATIQALPVPTWFWERCTALGGAILVPIGVALVLAALVSRRLRLAIIVGAVLIVAAVFTDVVKDFVARPRPTVNPLIPLPISYSYPSGHALNSTVTYGLLAVVAWRSGLPPWLRRAAAVAGVTIPILVGLSRIALGVHFPTDVLGGWLGGLAFVALAATLITQTRAMERYGRPSESPPA